MLVLSMLLEMFVVSNAINPNQMNIYNDIRKAKENHVNSSLKRLTKHVFCPKCNIQVRAANLEKHLAKHEVNPLMMPKIPHPPQPVRSPRKMKPPVIEIKKNAVKSSAVLRDNAEKSVSGWADKINRTGAELRALYEGKQLPKHKAEIRKAKFKATQDIYCLICKTPLKSSNLNKHYKKVHGIDIQIQELEISGVGELNQEGFISHWSLPGTGKQALESSCERIRGGKFEEIEEHFFEHWLRLFSEKGYTVAMVQAFRRTSESKHISKSEIKSFLEVVKPIKKKPQIQETTVCGKELSESVELIKELHLSSVKGVKKAIHTVGRDSQEQAAFRKAVSMNYNHRCAITGDEVAVEACHIQTHANYFDNSLDNGVLLSVGLHRLFDAGIMIICPETMTISFTRNCFYKKYLDGALVKQGRIPISKKKLSEKNSGIKICHEITPGLRDVIAEQDGDYTGR
ncbi:HNH endonuclease [Klebsiella pneumoniae]|nr:HNH endonuclease [Klebsiella pneumoniae]MBK3279795.1 HNH endonuclease [Klebsiella pneumoniae]